MVQDRPLRQLWLICLAITAGSYVIQLVPLLGWVSQILLFTPWWPSLFLNAAFVFMACDALAGRGLRQLLLLFPVLWFGAYEGMAAASHSEARQLRRAAEARNAGQGWRAAPPSRLILDNGPDDEYAGSDLKEQLIIRAYSVDEVFTPKGTSTRLVRQPCPKRGALVVNDVTYEWISRGGYPSHRPMQFADQLCMVTGPAFAPSGVVTIRSHHISYLHDLVDGAVQDIDILVAGRKPLTVRSLAIAPLPWFPFVAAGCHLWVG